MDGVTLIGTEVAGLMLQCTPRQVQRLVRLGLLTNHSTRKHWILLDVEDVARRASLTHTPMSSPMR